MSSIVYTKEVLDERVFVAYDRLGKHLILGVRFKNGFTIGKTYNKRLQGAAQWMWLVNKHVVVCGIGDFGDFTTMRTFLSSLTKEVESLIGIRYVSAAMLAKSALSFMRREEEEKANRVAVEIVVSDVRENLFWLIDIDCQMKQFTNFVVAGCYSFDELFTYNELTEKERSLIDMTFETYREKGTPIPEEEKCERRFPRERFVRKPAIAFLEQNGANGKITKEKAAALVLETLFENDPQSKSGVFEIISFVSHKTRGTSVERTLLPSPKKKIE